MIFLLCFVLIFLLCFVLIFLLCFRYWLLYPCFVCQKCKCCLIDNKCITKKSMVNLTSIPKFEMSLKKKLNIFHVNFIKPFLVWAPADSCKIYKQATYFEGIGKIKNWIFFPVWIDIIIRCVLFNYMQRIIQVSCNGFPRGVRYCLPYVSCTRCGNIRADVSVC